jgi:hypothetical protein
MKPSVYIETTIPSYLTGWPTENLLRMAQQTRTKLWWETRHEYSLFVSNIVIDECRGGDIEAAAQRLAALVGIPVLEQTAASISLAEELIKVLHLPLRAHADALHIAIAADKKIRYLLTWNCTHLANSALQRKIADTCRTVGMEAPFIATPNTIVLETTL